MITSEVQRTLVKSPPELWTELSDSDALARHLGELGEIGEIRITRTKPEELIEWEAERATGTVAIKASGWGTKVTLTVNRELTLASPEEDGEDAEDQLAADACEAQEPDATCNAAGTAAVEDPATGEDHSLSMPHVESTAEAPSATDVESAAEAENHVPELPADAAQAGSIPRPPPATEAARHAAGWFAAAHSDRSAESELHSGEEDPAVAASVPARTAVSEASVEEPSAAENGTLVEPEPELEPRRGFLARLFGRRRRREAVSAEATSHVAPEEVETDLLDPRAAASEPTEELDGAFQSPAPEADEPAQSVLSPADGEAAEAEAPTETVGCEATAETVGSAAPVETVGCEAPAQTVEAETLDEPVALGETLTADAAGESAPGDQQLAPAEDSGNGAREPSGADMAAELKAAEETAAEEVRAVLTSVLDRLGAAHHRPFSRS